MVRPYIAANIARHILTDAAERALKSGDEFHECAKSCPQMVVIPAGKSMIGSPDGQGEDDEHPQHEVTIAQPFAISKFEVTFDDWEECVALAGCPAVSDSDFGKGRRPVINVSWDEAKQYVLWLSMLTGKDYRLPSEAEWEHAARAGTTTAYSFGDDPAVICDYANLADRSLKKVFPAFTTTDSCDDGFSVTASVGSLRPNAFGLYDVHGNVSEWTEDCYVKSYDGAPTNGAPRQTSDCSLRVLRGGAWFDRPENLRTAFRGRRVPGYRSDTFGFRVARTLLPPAPYPSDAVRRNTP